MSSTLMSLNNTFKCLSVIITLLLCIFIIPANIYAQDSWILPMGDPAYRLAEEAFLLSGCVPPFEDTPVIADDLKENLARLSDKLRGKPDNLNILDTIDELAGSLTLPMYPVAPILETGFSLGYRGDPDFEHYIPTLDFYYDKETPANSDFSKSGKTFLDFMCLYELNQTPSLIKTGFIAQIGPWALLFQPELRAAMSSLLKHNNGTNFPSIPIRMDVNFPYRGLISYWSKYIEFRFGRDKLQIGPGRWSSLSVNKNLPYCDFVKVRFHLPWFSISSHLIRLNPIMTPEESDYLDAIYNGDIENPDDNTHHEKIRKEKSKHLAVAKLVVTPFSWLCIGITQNNLIGGRTPQFIDFSPLIIFHSTYEDGLYGVPLVVSLTLVPIKGIKLYGEYLLYEVTVADEVESSDNAGASAYQAGFTMLSEPFFKLGPGRFRLDCEFSLAEPWVYGKYYDLRKFTSRFVYVEPYEGRFWVDYPLGFYLGPDSLELALKLSYGKPLSWEVDLTWKHSGKGEVDLYGYGEDSDYSSKEDFTAKYVLTGTVQWTDFFKVSCYFKPVSGLTLSLWSSITIIRNRFNEAGNTDIFLGLGINAVWKIF